MITIETDSAIMNYEDLRIIHKLCEYVTSKPLIEIQALFFTFDQQDRFSNIRDVCRKFFGGDKS